MRLHSITLKDYRGITERHVDFDDHGITVIAGPNQSGKSSIIEAINLVLTEKATSTKNAVTAIRRSGVDRPAIVEFDATIGGERFTLRKEFGRGRQAGTTLTFATGNKAVLRGDPAHNYVQDLLRDHEDMALFAALSFLQGKDLSSFELTDGQSALQAALDAAANGNDDTLSGDHLLDAAQAEFDQYFTTTGRLTKERTNELKREKTLSEEASELAEHVAETERTAQQLDDLEQQREHLANQRAETEARLQDLTAQAAAHAEHQRQKAALEAQLRTTEAQLAAATSRVQADDDLAQQHAAISERITRIEQQQAELTQVDDAELHQLIEQRDQLAAAAAHYTQTAEIMDFLRRERLHHEEEAQAERLAQAAKQASDHLHSIPHDVEVYRHAEQLRADIEGLQHVLAVSSGTITVTPLPGGDVLCNGSPLTSAHTEIISRSLSIEVPGHVTITLHPAAEAAERDAQLSRLTADYQEALDSLHVADWSQACRQADEWQEANRAHQDAAAECRAFATLHPESRRLEEAHQLTQECAGFPSDLLDQGRAGTLNVLPKADVDELQSAFTEAQQRAEVALRNYEVSASKRDLLAQELAAAQQEYAQLDPLDQAARTAHQEKLASLTTAVATQRAELAQCENCTAAFADTTEEAADNTSTLATLRSFYDDVDSKYHRLQGVLDTHMSAGYHAALVEKRAQHRDLHEHIQRTTAAADAARLLRDTLLAARQRAAARYQTPYVKTLTRLGQRVWGDHFSVTVADNLTIVSAVTRPNGIPIAYSDLSTGTREQLAVLSRLACYQLVDQGHVPVILDDILGYSDPTRREDMAAAIETATSLATSDPAMAGQLIIFTCDSSRFASVPGKHHIWEQPLD